MNKRFFFVVTAASALTVSFAAPALAAPGDTTATVTVITGALQISVPLTPANLGATTNTLAERDVSGALGQVQVTDARSAVAGTGWVASAISSTFAPTSGPAIAASLVGYTAGTITPFGTATYTPTNRTDMTANTAVVTATAITGDNSATWNPLINVKVGQGTVAGTYTATITHSVV